MLISPEYRAMNEQMHREKPQYGTSGAHYAEAVRDTARRVKAESILDYGSGKSLLAKALPDLSITCYDPAIPEISAPPGPADLVVCTDVLEHIEPEHLSYVLDDLKRLALKACLLSIHTGEAAKHLPDGRNAHLIQKPDSWWLPEHLLPRWNMHSAFGADLGFMFIGLTKCSSS